MMVAAYSHLKRILNERNMTVPELYRRMVQAGMRINLKSLYQIRNRELWLMSKLTDAAILVQFDTVLANWNYTGYITAKDVVLEWIANNLAGLTLKDVAKAMHLYFQNGGTIDQVAETRPEWSCWPFHYDFRFPIAGRMIYIETILRDDDPTDPAVHIMSIHDV